MKRKAKTTATTGTMALDTIYYGVITEYIVESCAESQGCTLDESAFFMFSAICISLDKA